jgi:Ca2+-binding EF-hand superfamily protein
LAADSIITKHDFILRMSSLVGLIPLEEEIRMLFRSFDTRDRGFITWEDFWQSCNRIAPHLPATAVFDAFQEVDTDRDGRVAFRDFDRLMRSADPTK